MDQNTIFSTLRAHLISLLPELANHTITLEDSLQSLGANSMDRAEIIIETMASFNLRLPMVRFGQAKCIGDIVDIITRGVSETCHTEAAV